jgi:hypothetical protein
LRRVRRLVAAALVPIAFAGCYGSTEPATDVTTDAATLHGRGTANNGPVDTWFEYRPTHAPETRSTSSSQTYPGGVSGPFSQRVSGLQSATDYTFRLCGSDQGGEVCAQVRRFATGGGDSVRGEADEGEKLARANASSGPAGESPSGTFGLLDESGDVPRGFLAPVECISIEGDTALLAGTTKPFVGGTVGLFVTFYARIVVSSEPGRSTFEFHGGDATPNPACSSYDGDTEAVHGDFVIVDN